MNAPSRREELIAAALADDLNPQERREFEQASADDPTIAHDLQELQETAERLDRAGLSWQEQEPPPDLADRVLAATAGTTADGTGTTDADTDSTTTDDTGSHSSAAPAPSHRGRRSIVFGLAAAGLVAVGGVGGALGGELLDAPPEGPPGTLGALEEVTFSQPPAGISIAGALVAHTWGTETVLEMDGFEIGESFEVILVSGGGQEFSSGTFLGAEETVTCRMNAAVLREDVSELQIRDTGGSVVVASQVPEV